MKKLTFTFIILVVLLSFSSQQKKVKVELTRQQWQAVVTIMDMSTAPHADVNTAMGWIIKQVNDTLINKP
jgi:hypothetical protein